MDKPTLYHAGPSFYSMIARLALAEKNAPYHSHVMDIHFKLDHFKPEYVRLNSNLTIPTLVCGDKVFDSSESIMRFVDSSFGSERLTIGSEEEDSFIKEFYSFPVEALTLGKILHTKKRVNRFFLKQLHREMELVDMHIKENPDLSDIYKGKRKIIEARIAGFDPEQIYERYQSGLTSGLKLVKYIDSILSPSNKYFFGDKYSLADILNTVLLARFRLVNEPSLYRYSPKLEAYWNALKDRPSFNKADIWTKLSLFRILKQRIISFFS